MRLTREARQPAKLTETVIISRLFCLSPMSQAIEVDPASLGAIHPARLLDISESSGLSAVLYANLRPLGLLQQLDDQSAARLELAYADGLRRHSERVRQLQHLHRLFGSANLRYLLLKDYPFDPSQPTACLIRQGDFDVLVRPADLVRAGELLVNEGYWRVERPWDDEYRYKHPDFLSIDLHTSLNPGGGWAHNVLNEEDAFARSSQIPVGSESIQVLNRVDATIFLLIHLTFHHNFTPFKAVVNCWNHLARIDSITVEQIPWVVLGHLPRLAMEYLEKLTGYALEWSTRLVAPDRLTRRLFQEFMPDPGRYFGERTSHELTRRCRQGLHLCLYPGSARGKLESAVRAVKSRFPWHRA